MFFTPLRNEKLNILEIGIDKGNSLLTWRDYFKESEIHGIDIRGDYEYLHDDRTFTHIVDQSKKEELTIFGQKYPEYFDVIIVDGSHNAEDDILTFNTLFPYLKPGGLFCIEDLNCSRDLSRWGKNANVYDRIKAMIDELNMSNKASNDMICANKKQERNKYDLNYFERNIEWVFNSMSLVIIKKM
jgi:hypothetical protein